MSDPFSVQLERYRNAVNAALLDVGKDGEPAYLYDPVRYVLSGKGKRLRPALVLLTAEAFGAAEEEALPAALAVELLHNFSLVHDDIMDGDDLRHGKETVHKRWDESAAILAGDGIFALAFDQLTRLKGATTECLKEFTQATLRLCEGQALDKEFELRDGVSVEEYLEMVRLKTGTLLSLCCRLGAIMGRASAEELRLLGDFGERVGQAFQIQDDIFEIFSNSDRMGKSLGSDVLTGKKTFLTCFASEQHASAWGVFADGLSGDLTSEVLPELRNFFDENGVLKAGEQKAESLVSDVISNLQTLPEEKRTNLESFVRTVLNRKY